jgi:hypothetical protein
MGQLKRLPNIELRLDTDATPEIVLQEKSDVVVLATGSMPKKRPFQGDYSPPGVLNVWQVLNEEFDLGQRVLIVDMDGHHATGSLVELAASKGKSVHVVTPALSIGGNLAPLQDFFTSRQRLTLNNVTFTADAAVLEIQGLVVKCVQVYSGEFF